MTGQESADAQREQRTIVALATYDEFLDDAFCPVCGTRITEPVDTLTVPTAFLDIDSNVDPDSLPTFGWQCDCRRAVIAVIAPIEVTPETGTSVDLTVDDEPTTIAVRESALETTRSLDA